MGIMDNLMDALKVGWEVVKRSTSFVVLMLVLSLFFGGSLAYLQNLIYPMGMMPVGRGLVTLLSFAVMVFVSAGAYGYLWEVLRTGKSELGRVWSDGKKYFLRMAGVLLSAWAIAFSTGMLGMSLATIAGSNLLMYLVCLAVLLVSLFMTLAPLILVVEDVGVLDALRKSFDVVRKNFLNIIALAFLVAISVGIVVFLVYTILSMVFSAQSYLGFVLLRTTMLVVQAMALAFSWAVLLAWYGKTEGKDLAL